MVGALIVVGVKASNSRGENMSAGKYSAWKVEPMCRKVMRCDHYP
jgi:hypothetical protein